jgi:hypothetical protein
MNKQVTLGECTIDHQWSQCKGQFCGPPLYIYLTLEELLKVEFCTWSVLRLCSEDQWEKLARRSEGSQSRQTVKYGHESHGSQNQESLVARTSSNLVVSQRVLSCIVSSHYLATTSEQTGDFIWAVVVVICRVCKSVKTVIVICSCEL